MTSVSLPYSNNTQTDKTHCNSVILEVILKHICWKTLPETKHQKMKFLVVFALFVSFACAKSTIKKDLKALNFHIDDHTPDQVLNEGQTLTLECRVKSDLIDGNDDWKTCRWTRASDGATCLYEYKKVQDSIINSHWEIEEFCEPGMSDAIYFGSDPNVENHICGIEFLAADQTDNGDWKCTIEECKMWEFGGCSANNGNGNYVEATMNVKVNPAK